LRSPSRTQQANYSRRSIQRTLPMESSIYLLRRRICKTSPLVLLFASIGWMILSVARVSWRLHSLRLELSFCPSLPRVPIDQRRVGKSSVLLYASISFANTFFFLLKPPRLSHTFSMFSGWRMDHQTLYITICVWSYLHGMHPRGTVLWSDI